jgi:hypothetical protein
MSITNTKVVPKEVWFRWVSTVYEAYFWNLRILTIIDFLQMPRRFGLAGVPLYIKHTFGIIEF